MTPRCPSCSSRRGSSTSCTSATSPSISRLATAIRALGAAWLVVVAAGCDSNEAASPANDAGSDAPDFTTVDPLDDVDAALGSRVRRVFSGTCAGVGNDTNCHGHAAEHLTLDLSPDGGDVIDVPSLERPDLYRVKPGAPDESYLILKVRGDGGIEGGRMPLGATTFDPRLPALIEAWIEAGAP